MRHRPQQRGADRQVGGSRTQIGVVRDHEIVDPGEQHSEPRSGDAVSTALSRTVAATLSQGEILQTVADRL